MVAVIQWIAMVVAILYLFLKYRKAKNTDWRRRRAIRHHQALKDISCFKRDANALEMETEIDKEMDSVITHAAVSDKYIIKQEVDSFVTHKYNSKGEKSSADVMKGGDYKVRTKYPYRSEGQSRSTKQQPVMRNNQDSHINGSHLCPSSGRQANLTAACGILDECVMVNVKATEETYVIIRRLNSTGNQSDKGLIYCNEFVGDKVTGEAIVTSFAGLRRRFNSAVGLLQMAAATQGHINCNASVIVYGLFRVRCAVGWPLGKIGCSSEGGSSRARVQLALQLTTLRERLMTERWTATRKNDNLTVLNQQANMVGSVELSNRAPEVKLMHDLSRRHAFFCWASKPSDCSDSFCDVITFIDESGGDGLWYPDSILLYIL
ncbi:hypothetical protein T07_10373 [Trichinella nelsoni]|uniref:Uncharacterized protein n=1 Tax=Trichinella nelsoni TaxID=6336 RepID=A0A0V0REE0_9BILA|nr:hypothetical protein T07_10373 [Trichinella nelsoni]